jgi:cytochrome b6-f complex iron-sulfur subunit
MPCTDCFNRREFLARTALAAAAIVAAEGCGDGQIGPPSHGGAGGDPNLPLGGPITIKISDFPGLAIVGRIVDIGHERAVVRTSDAPAFLGLSRICTHEQCDADVVSNLLDCSCHGSLFSATGSVIRGPATSPLRQLDVALDQAAGTLTVA